jgi:hypothetical protein
MDALDLFFKKYSYKFDKGYPDMNNDQDVLLLETILKEVGFPMDLNEITEEDSPNLPEDILKLKQDIQSIPGLENITTVKKSGGKEYSFYAKGTGDRDRKERTDIAKKIVQNLPKEYSVSENNFNKTEDAGPFFIVNTGNNNYKILLKGLGKSPFDTDTDQKEGLVILMYNILNAGEDLKPFNKETLESNVNILEKAIGNSSMTSGMDAKSINSINLLIKAISNSDIENFPNNKFKNLNNPYSIALKIKSTYPEKKIIRDGIFNEVRAKGQQLCKIPADKWNPGDIYIQLSNVEGIPNDLVDLNNLFVNEWGGKNHSLVSVSLKESSSQPGRAKSYFSNFTNIDGKLRDQEYNLSKEEIGWDVNTLTQKTKEQQQKLLNTLKGKKIKLTGDGWNNLPENETTLRGKYGSYKLLNFLFDNSDIKDPRKNILALVSYGLSLSGVNPTFFKLKGTDDGSEASDPVIFPAGSTTGLAEDPEINDNSKAGGFLLKTTINTIQGDEIKDTKSYQHRFRTSGGPQISIV